MPKITLNDLITSQILGADDSEGEDVTITKETPAPASPRSAATDVVEKLASALDFLGRRGVESFLVTEKTAMAMETNEGKKPGSGGSVDTTGKQTGTQHPGLASAESVAKVTKSDKAKLVAPSLDAVLSQKAFADSGLKQTLQHASASGEKNFRKTAATGDLAEIRQELARRVALSNNARNA